MNLMSFMYKEGPRDQSRTMGRWSRRAMTLLYAATLAYPMGGVLAIMFGLYEPSGEGLMMMLLSALVSAMTLTVLNLDLIERVRRRRKRAKDKKRQQQVGA